MHSELVQPLEGGSRRIICEYALGQLELEQCGREAVFIEGATHEPGELNMFQLLAGAVERQPRRRNVLVTPGGELRAGGIEHPAADVDDQPALLRGRHEFTGL